MGGIVHFLDSMYRRLQSLGLQELGSRSDSCILLPVAQNRFAIATSCNLSCKAIMAQNIQSSLENKILLGSACIGDFSRLDYKNLGQDLTAASYCPWRKLASLFATSRNLSCKTIMAQNRFAHLLLSQINLATTDRQAHRRKSQKKGKARLLSPSKEKSIIKRTMRDW